MKKILFGLLIIVIACKSTQELKTSSEKNVVSISKNPNYKEFRYFKGDTLKYLQTNFLTNQDFYIGKPLNILLDDLELQINYYLTVTSGINKKKSPSLGMSPYNKSQIEKKLSNDNSFLLINIEWETSLPIEKVDELLIKNKGKWTIEEKNYYGRQIIKEINISY